MKLHFLGTGAADWDIAEKDGQEFRFFSSALINDELLVDPGPHIFMSAEKFGIDLSNIKYVINTHRHEDHFCKETLDTLVSNGAEFFDLTAGDVECFDGYKIAAYKANHATCEGSVHFIIEKDGKRLFYGLDSAWLLYDEVAAIKENGGVDAAVLDATIGNVEGDHRIFEHNNLEMIRIIKSFMKKYIKKFIISHMARTLHDEHSVLAAQMEKEDITAAYDNFIIEI